MKTIDNIQNYLNNKESNNSKSDLINLLNTPCSQTNNFNENRYKFIQAPKEDLSFSILLFYIKEMKRLAFSSTTTLSLIEEELRNIQNQMNEACENYLSNKSLFNEDYSQISDFYYWLNDKKSLAILKKEIFFLRHCFDAFDKRSLLSTVEKNFKNNKAGFHKVAQGFFKNIVIATGRAAEVYAFNFSSREFFLKIYPSSQEAQRACDKWNTVYSLLNIKDFECFCLKNYIIMPKCPGYHPEKGDEATLAEAQCFLNEKGIFHSDLILLNKNQEVVQDNCQNVFVYLDENGKKIFFPIDPESFLLSKDEIQRFFAENLDCHMPDRLNFISQSELSKKTNKFSTMKIALSLSGLHPFFFYPSMNDLKNEEKPSVPAKP